MIPSQQPALVLFVAVIAAYLLADLFLLLGERARHPNVLYALAILMLTFVCAAMIYLYMLGGPYPL
jgi:NADH:ubiquinone oxidoreductase subunit 6 (subunit J)